MKFKKTLITLVSTTILTATFAPLTANAATLNNHEKNNVEKVYSVDEEPTVYDIQNVDPFISVEDNQFTLNLPDNVEIDDATYDAVISSINKVNDKIISDNGTINTYTKEVHFNTNKTGSIRAMSSQGYTSQTFWWGERGTYTNTQTNTAVKQINAAAAQTGFMGFLLGYVPVFGTLAVVPGLTAGYLTLLAAKMDAANHGRGVIVDMTWALVFTVKSR